jgi:hypothetical protein
VEQSAAAAESLREQAHKLASAVAGFKLDARAQAAAAPAPTPNSSPATDARAAPALPATTTAAAGEWESF